MISGTPSSSNSPFRKTVCGGVIASWVTGLSAEHRGETVYFCRLACLRSFKANPDRFIRGEIEHPQAES